MLNSSITNAYNQGLADATNIYIDNLPDTLVYTANADNNASFNAGSRQGNCKLCVLVPNGYTRAEFSCAADATSISSVNRFYCTKNNNTVYDGTDISSRICTVSEGDNLFCYIWLNTNVSTEFGVKITLYK